MLVWFKMFVCLPMKLHSNLLSFRSQKHYKDLVKTFSSCGSTYSVTILRNSWKAELNNYLNFINSKYETTVFNMKKEKCMYI